MTEPPERTIRKFNPGVFQSDEEVKDQFVVRNREMETVLEVPRGNIDAPSCQHTLVVAPRGRGKTMLLARAAAELRTGPKLREALLPVRFMEESLEVFTIGDFWLEALFYLAKECAGRHPELSRELEETHSALVRDWRDSGIGDRARVALLDAAERLGRKLVLMVENLQGLTEDVDRDFGWQLRQSLQTDPEIMLLATATSRFEGLDDAEEPFFELFRILKLGPLSTKECQRLWRVVSGDSRDEREMRALEILTGGSPRLLVIVAEFARHRSQPQLLEELVTLIDDHTEYFRGHMEELPKTERRVYLAVADLWRASSTREVADRAQMDVLVLGHRLDLQTEPRRLSILPTLSSDASATSLTIAVMDLRNTLMCNARSPSPPSSRTRWQPVSGHGIPVRWLAMGVKAHALVLQGDEPAALGVFSAICGELDSGNGRMIHKVVWDTIGLIADGASPDRFADVLADAAEQSDTLLPLLAALRKLAGQSMRVPEKMSRVADDVIKEIDARRR